MAVSYTYRFSLKALMDEVDVVNVHHIQFDDLPQSSDLSDMAEQLDVIWETHLQDANSTAFLMRGWDVQRMDIPSSPTYSYNFQGISDGYGDDGTSALPPQVALVVNFTCPTLYPRRGRTYLGGFTETGNTVPGIPASGTLTAGAAWANAMLNFDEVGGLVPKKVAVRYTGSPPYVILVNPYTTYNVAIHWGTLRSRRT
jgi:hypothetical protein